MTQEEIIEGNKLIAKFIEFKSTNKCVRSKSGKYYDYHSNPNFICIKEDEIWVESEKGYGLVEQDYLFVEDLKFNSSWDWLMPCIGKISNICEEPEELDGLKYALLCNDIETAWNFVVDYLIDLNT